MLSCSISALCILELRIERNDSRGSSHPTHLCRVEATEASSERLCSCALSGGAAVQVWDVTEAKKDLSRACLMRHSRSAGRDTGATGKGDRQA